MQNLMSTIRTKKMPLTSQDKLALALTSAGSMRNLAKLVGVSHQKIGRWLREGQPGGAKSIPADATAAINVAFQFHSDISKQQSKIDRTFYDPNAPVFFERPTIRSGVPGERLAVNNTEYISQKLRDQIFRGLKKTNQIFGISVRSQINLRSYLGAKSTANVRTLTDKFTDRRRNQKKEYKNEKGQFTLLGSFKNREAEKPGSGFIAPINTRAIDFKKQADVQVSIRDINFLLSSKHSPHAIALADQFLIQTLPGQYANQSKPKKQTAAQKRASLKRR
jgi:hypothetical protein